MSALNVDSRALLIFGFASSSLDCKEFFYGFNLDNFHCVEVFLGCI